MQKLKILSDCSNKILLRALTILSILIITAQANFANSFFVEKQKKITIASEPDYPPYCIINKEGKADGFAIDLFKESAAAVGLKLEIKIGVWNKIKQDLADGNIDALPLVGRTPERESLFDFTMPYLTLHGAIFVRRGDNSIHSIEDLKNKTILVMKGDNAEEFVRRENLSDNIVTTNTFIDAFRLLEDEDYDAIVMQEVMGLKLLEDLKINSIVVSSVKLPKFKQDFCFAVKKGNKELLNLLNEGLSIVVANKAYYNIHLKWFGPQAKEKISVLQILLYLLYILVPISILMGILFILTLKRQVAARTKNLNQEIQIRRLNEQKTELYNRILELYHRHEITKYLIQEIIFLIQDFSKCDAVGIRLKEENNYPYYESLGFTKEDFRFENNLCYLDTNGESKKDELGNSFPECMCENIIGGKFNPSEQFVSPNGSYWTNCKSLLQDSTSENDRQIRTRNRCIDKGYESVAIIPIKGENGNLGLLQLKDKKTNRFTAADIKFFENLSEAIGITLYGKKAEEELKAKNKFIQTVLDNLPIGVALNKIKDGTAFYMNSQFENIYGWPSDKIKDISQFFNCVYPDPNYRNQMISKIMEGINSGDTSKMRWEDIEIIHEDGSKHYINAVNIPLPDQDTMVSTVFDVTNNKIAEEALLKSKERFMHISSTISDISYSCVKNNDTQAIDWLTGAVFQMTGYSIDEILLMKCWGKIVIEEDYHLFKKHVADVLPGNSDKCELRIRHKDGSLIWIESFVECVKVESNSESSILYGGLVDITARKLIEQELLIHRNNLEDLVKTRTDELNAANAELIQKIEKEKELSEMKSRFISTTSHEFRTPLTTILSSAELIQRNDYKWSDEKKNEHFMRIQKSVEYLTKLLNDVLTISRAERGKISFNPQIIDMQNLVNECIIDAKAQLTKDHKLNINFNPNKNLFEFDPKLIKFILSNLLSNAVKYSPFGGQVSLDISTINEHLIIKVSDQGLGIAKDDQEKIFESFYRSKNITAIPGTGLGLAIVKRAVDLHGGTISVESELNDGTTFKVSLPISES